MVVWTRTFRKAYGTKLTPSAHSDVDDDLQDEDDPYADVEDEIEAEEETAES
jgi:hypothetical protein